ncbi:MAG: helix-turn-helix transcriptional regulator [Lactococcus chungangensis]|jgi:transcriptional regulator with XRE-family HTH domain
MATFAERLKFLRKEKKLTQQELADKLGMSRVGYGYWEKGSREPDLKMLLKLSELLNASLDYLMGNSDYNFMDTKQMILKSMTANESEQKEIERQSQVFFIESILIQIVFLNRTYDDIRELLIKNGSSPSSVEDSIKEAQRLEKIFREKISKPKQDSSEQK